MYIHTNCEYWFVSHCVWFFGGVPQRTVADPVSSQYWLWCGILAPILGALASSGIYELFLAHVPDKDTAQSVR